MMRLYLVLTAIFGAVQISEQLSVNKVLEVGQPYEFTTPLYPNREPAKEMTHEWNFQVDGGANIKVVCDVIHMMLRYPWSDDCPYVYLTIRDGNNDEKKICYRFKSNYIYKSNESNLRIKLVTSFNGTGIFKCSAINLAKPKDTKLIQFKHAGEVEIINMENIENDYVDQQWIFLGPDGTRISYQCEMSLNKIEPMCGKDVLIFNNGENDEEYCDHKNYVWISKNSRSSIRLQLRKETRGYLICRVQAITGTSINEHENLIPEEEVDSSEHGLLTEDQTFNAQPQTNCECGWTNKARSRVYLGNETNPNEFPWMVNLIITMRENETYSWDGICGASIITPRHILTAAHCVVSKIGVVPVGDVKIILGKHDEHSPSKHEKTLDAKEIHVGELYLQKGIAYDDIAVIVTKETIEFNRFIGPICIESEYYDILHKNLLVMGWGATEENRYSRYLRKGKVFVIDKTYCNGNEWDICGKTFPSNLCLGDSGGPFVFKDPETNRYTQISLASRFAPGTGACGDNGVSTSVTYYHDWIQKIIKASVPNVHTCHKI